MWGRRNSLFLNPALYTKLQFVANNKTLISVHLVLNLKADLLTEVLEGPGTLKEVVHMHSELNSRAQSVTRGLKSIRFNKAFSKSVGIKALYQKAIGVLHSLVTAGFYRKINTLHTLDSTGRPNTHTDIHTRTHN